MCHTRSGGIKFTFKGASNIIGICCYSKNSSKHQNDEGKIITFVIQFNRSKNGNYECNCKWNGNLFDKNAKLIFPVFQELRKSNQEGHYKGEWYLPFIKMCYDIRIWSELTFGERFKSFDIC